MKEFSLGSVGDTLTLTVHSDVAETIAKDISTATAVYFVIKKPDETVVEVTAAFVDDGTDGEVTYDFIAGDKDLEGLYDVQVRVAGVPYSGQSTSYQFLVRETHIAP